MAAGERCGPTSAGGPKLRDDAESGTPAGSAFRSGAGARSRVRQLELEIDLGRAAVGHRDEAHGHAPGVTDHDDAVAARAARAVLGEGAMATLNADAVWAGPNPLAQLRAAWQPDRMDALLICVPMTRVHGRAAGGDFTIDAQGRLHRGGDTVYGGAQILKTELLHGVPEQAFSLNTIWNMMAQRKRLFGLTYPGHWCDVGHPGGIAEAEQMLAQTRV